jgi:hypothetical protein
MARPLPRSFTQSRATTYLSKCVQHGCIFRNKADQDGGKAGAFKVKQALSEGGRSNLTTTTTTAAAAAAAAETDANATE